MKFLLTSCTTSCLVSWKSYRSPFGIPFEFPLNSYFKPDGFLSDSHCIQPPQISTCHWVHHTIGNLHNFYLIPIWWLWLYFTLPYGRITLEWLWIPFELLLNSYSKPIVLLSDYDWIRIKFLWISHWIPMELLSSSYWNPIEICSKSYRNMDVLLHYDSTSIQILLCSYCIPVEYSYKTLQPKPKPLDPKT